MDPQDAGRMVKNVESDLGLHCLHSPVCPKT